MRTILALTVGAALLVGPASADEWRGGHHGGYGHHYEGGYGYSGGYGWHEHHHGNGWVPGVALGLGALGVLGGAMLYQPPQYYAQPHPYYAQPQYYYAPPPPQFYPQPQPFYAAPQYYYQQRGW